MTSPGSKAVRDRTAVPIDAHAAASLRYIRASMDAASVLSVPGSAAIAAGAIGLAATGLALLPAFRDQWLVIWLAAAVLAVSTGGTLLAKGSRLSLGGAPLRRFALCLLPSLFAGAVMTALHLKSGDWHSIPGTWLLLYGCGLVSASVVTGMALGFLGAVFVVLGLATFLVPDGLHVAMLGIGFGGVHVAFGLYMRGAGHGR